MLKNVDQCWINLAVGSVQSIFDNVSIDLINLTLSTLKTSSLAEQCLLS